MRGIAALSVVGLHLDDTIDNLIGKGLVPVGFDPSGVTRYFDKSYLWVDFFFMLSGLLMALVYGTVLRPGFRRRDYLDFIGRRLARIYPLHLLMLLVFVGIELLKYRVPTYDSAPFTGPHGPVGLLQHLLLIQGWPGGVGTSFNYVSWSVSTEFLAYLLLPLLLVLLRWGSWPLAIATALAGLAALLWLSTVDPALQLNQSAGLAILRCLPSFGIGILIARLVETRDQALRRLGGAAGAAAALILAVLLLHLGAPDILLIPVFAWIVLSLALDGGTVARALSWRPLHLLGLWSYSIYMVHPLVLKIEMQVLLRSGDRLQSLPYLVAVSAAALLAVVLLAALLFRWVEVPARRALYARLDRRRPAALAA
ncbi:MULTISPECIES: acyltransferase family protein [unclassified Inquilinus]|uniref:acyltransferase family protein n=1 Tax=unclassified Inquilinus TaxID=2645927 RepID=UPI003F8FE569